MNERWPHLVQVFKADGTHDRWELKPGLLYSDCSHDELEVLCYSYNMQNVTLKNMLSEFRCYHGRVTTLLRAANTLFRRQAHYRHTV